MVLSTGSFSREIGPKPLLDSFFDTVGCRLEPAGRGTRFPAIMSDLYQGVLKAEQAAAALTELSEIERGLRALPPDKVLGQLPAQHGSNAYESLVSPDGRPLLAHIRAAVEESARSGKFLQVSLSQGHRVPYQLALIAAATGVIWVFLGRKFFGHWILVSQVQDPEDHGGLYIWCLGFVMIGTSAAFALGTAFPLLRLWFKRHQWATLVVALVAVGVLIYFGSSN